nr:nicotinamide riboside transporter PnuC [Psychrosphaera sp. F3M07]
MFEQILAGFEAMSGWEYVGVFLGLAYLILVMKESLWCWPAAFISTLIYTILFWQGALLMESLLSFYYLLMAIYGWWQWRKADKTASATDSSSIVSWAATTHIKWIAAATVISVVLGYVMDEHTHAKMAYLDSFTTVFAVMTTYMVTQKVLENWLYWIVIDLASIFLYVEMNYYPTAILFVLYTGLAWQGYLIWRKQLPVNQAIHYES